MADANLLLLTGWDQLGLTLTVLGLLLLTFWSGYWTGRRRRRS
ncbi:LPXTG cell wall anchor domain-containing protein [Arthrobacter sp. VKM Ac-2550]|nr:LPXTG cell wall anchor domain-containing protein [Arthrobacter sp. VKM Ac-2550]